MFKFAIAAAVFGSVVLYSGYQDWQLTQVIKPTPQTISCQQLGDLGPGDNHHIILSDFVFPEGYVYEETDTGQLTKVWIPAIPLGGQAHHALEKAYQADTEFPNIDFDVIVEINDINSFDQLETYAGLDTLQGFLVNEVRGIDNETRDLLRDGYPGVDTDNCWILVIGKDVPTASLATAKLGGGAVLILIAGALGLAGLRSLKGDEPLPDSVSGQSHFATQSQIPSAPQDQNESPANGHAPLSAYAAAHEDDASAAGSQKLPGKKDPPPLSDEPLRRTA